MGFAARIRVVVTLLLAFVGGYACSAAEERPPWTCSFSVSPKMGVSQTTRSGEGGLNSMRSWNRDTSSSRTTTKTISRSMKWEAQVRFRGKEKPQKVELKITYIGNRGASAVPVIFKQETRTLKLDEAGKAVEEFESPVTRLTKTRTNSGGNSRGFVSSRSQTSGERVTGCIAQVYADSLLVKSYASDSRWEAVAKEGPVTQESLTRRRKNSLQ